MDRDKKRVLGHGVKDSVSGPGRGGTGRVNVAGLRLSGATKIDHANYMDMKKRAVSAENKLIEIKQLLQAIPIADPQGQRFDLLIKLNELLEGIPDETNTIEAENAAQSKNASEIKKHTITISGKGWPTEEDFKKAGLEISKDYKDE
jgi:hypothetical protein